MGLREDFEQFKKDTEARREWDVKWVGRIESNQEDLEGSFVIALQYLFGLQGLEVKLVRHRGFGQPSEEALKEKGWRLIDRNDLHIVMVRKKKEESNG